MRAPTGFERFNPWWRPAPGGMGGFSPNDLFLGGESGARWPVGPGNLLYQQTNPAKDPVTQVGQTVAHIADASPNSNYMAAFPSTEPTYSRAPDGAYYLDFTGTQYMYRQTALSLPLTLWYVVDFDGAMPNQLYLSDPAAGGAYAGIKCSSTGIVADYKGAVTAEVTVAPGRFAAVAEFTSGGVTLWADGAEKHVPGALDLSLVDSWSMGIVFQSGKTASPAHIYCAGGIERSLTGKERADLLGALGGQ